MTINELLSKAGLLSDWLNRVGGWVVRGQVVGRVPLNINIFPSGLAINFGKVFESICLTLACAFAENECIN